MEVVVKGERWIKRDDLRGNLHGKVKFSVTFFAFTITRVKRREDKRCSARRKDCSGNVFPRQGCGAEVAAGSPRVWKEKKIRVERF